MIILQANPWEFGWNQVLTIAGLLTTIIIARSGFQTLEKWRRQKIEEKKIDIALEALAVAYQMEDVFGHIRSTFVYKYELAEVPRVEGETEEQGKARSTYRVHLWRMDQHRSFFEKVSNLQPRFMAAFGHGARAIFQNLQQARSTIVHSARMLAEDRTALKRELREKAENAIWVEQAEYHGTDDVGDKLKEFRQGIEKLCFPVLAREFDPARKTEVFVP
jgi:hypothetical protein